MKAEGFIDGYLEKFRDGEGESGYGVGCTLMGVKQMYDALGDEKYFSFIDEYLKHFVMEDGSIEKGYADRFDAGSVNCCKLLYFMYDKTGEEKYRNAVEAVMSLMREQTEMLSPNQVSLEALYMVQPFYMEYETRYDKKAKYSDIIGEFEKAQNYLKDDYKDNDKNSDRDNNGNNDKDNGNYIDRIGLYLMALIDALDGMSFEIYEKYRKLQDMFKLALAELLKQGGNDGEGVPASYENAGYAGNAMIAYSIIKACRMGLLLKEKYAPIGMGIVEKLTENSLSEIFSDDGATGAGVFISTYGQYLQLKAELEA